MPHIAIIRLSAMGDVAMTVPVIQALVQQHPNVKVTLVSRAFFKPFFDQIPQVTFFAVDLKKRHKGFLGLLRLYCELKALAVTHIADLHNVLRSNIVRYLFKFTGIPTGFIDKGRAEKKALTRSSHKILKPLKSTHQRYADVFTKLGFSIDLNKANTIAPIPLSEKIITIAGTKDSLWIGIAPFAQHLPKTYPLDLTQKIINLLYEPAYNFQKKL